MRLAGGRASLILLPFVAGVGLAGLLAVRFDEISDRQRQLIRHTYEVIQTARSVLAEVQDAETGQRGYILTGDDAELTLYRRGSSEVVPKLAGLAALVSDNPEQVARARELDERIRERLGELAEALAVANAGGVDAARAELMARTGPSTSVAVRALVDTMITAENDLLQRRVEDAAGSQRRMRIFALSGITAALIGLGLAAALLLRLNQRLRASEATAAAEATIVQSVIESIGDGVAAFDAQGRLQAFNRRGLGDLGFAPSLARLGTPITSFREHADLELADLFAPSDTSSPASTVMYRGERALEIHRNPMQGGGLVITCHDATRRLDTEAMLRQSQKMEAVGQLTGGVAHDFNNLLQVIGSSLDLLEGGVRTPADRRWLEAARSSVARGAGLTRQLLAFARRQPLLPRAVDVGRLLAGMADLLQRALGERVKVELAVSAGSWTSFVDPAQVENAVLNLAINARDAMPDGGSLTIEVGEAVLDAAYAAAHAEVDPGRYVTVAVTDTGVGMSGEVRARVFEPFFTTKPEGQGTGLGLSMVYGFIKQSKGHVKIYSEAGHGTTVRLYLPMTDADAEPAWSPVDEPEAVGGGERVLVVEDDPGVRMTSTSLLRELGYQVGEAADIGEARTMLACEPAFDLLFTDVVVPGPISPRQLAEEARGRQPGLAVLYTSGYAEGAVVQSGRLHADVLLLGKPFGREELARKVREALSWRAPPARRRQVLLVEDDAIVRLATAELLDELGYTVTEIGDGAEALRLLGGRDDIDVVVTDQQLPGANGSAIAAAVIERGLARGVIIVSGYGADGIPPGLLSNAMVTVLAKPFERSALHRALRHLAGS